MQGLGIRTAEARHEKYPSPGSEFRVSGLGFRGQVLGSRDQVGVEV